MKTIVVGGGIIGASIAWHLARAGSDVVVLDGLLPAATAASFGWINASFYADPAHHRLRVAGLQGYARLRQALPDLPVRQTGALWFETQGAALHRMKSDLEDLQYPVEHVSGADLRALEPDVTGVPREALVFPSEGVAEPLALAQALLMDSGAKVMRGLRVERILGRETVEGVMTSLGPVQGDRVVVAAGNGAPDLVQAVGVRLPMLTRPGVMVTTQPVAARIRHVLVTPHGEVRQRPDGRLVASAVANHQGIDDTDVTETPDAIAARLLGWLGPMIRGGVPDWDEVTLAYRPVPQDGRPVIGAAGPAGLYLAVMHSGVTLAAVAGEIAAAEVLGQGHNRFAGLVSSYRPDRFN